MNVPGFDRRFSCRSLHDSTCIIRSDSPRAIRRFTNVNVGPNAHGVLVRAQHAVPKLDGVSGLDKINGAAAKTGSRHPGPPSPFLSQRKLDHQIEFGATDFIIVAQADV